MSDKSELVRLLEPAKASLARTEAHNKLVARGLVDAQKALVHQQDSACLASVQTYTESGNGKYGFIDKTGRFVIPPIFDHAYSPFVEGFALVGLRREGRFVDIQGRLLDATECEPFTDFRAGFAWGRNGDRFGLINKAGETMFLKEFEQVRDERDSCDGRYGVQIGQKWGFIDGTGAMVIAPQFDSVGFFCDGLVEVLWHGKWGFIDAQGGGVGAKDFDSLDSFSEGFARFGRGDKYGFIDKRGKEVIKAKFDGAGTIYKGLTYAEVKGMRGLINAQGDFVVPPVYDGIDFFSEDVVRTKVGTRWGLTGTGGNCILQPKYRSIGRLREGLAVINVADSFHFFGIEGAIDPRGQVVIQPQFTGLSGLSNGVAKALADSRKHADRLYGYVNRYGDFIIPPSYNDDELQDFRQGLAWVFTNGKWGAIDTEGREAISPQFSDASPFALVEADRKKLEMEPLWL